MAEEAREYQWFGSAARSCALLTAVGLVGWFGVLGHDLDLSGGGAVDVATSDAAAGGTAPGDTVPDDTADPGVEVAGRSTIATATTAPLPSGLTCAELEERGTAYADVVRYWNGNAQPDELDEDADGAPCESQYPASVVRAELGTGSGSSGTTVAPPRGLDTGLTCAQLKARGVGAADAVSYFVSQGSPSRMDADGNGIPCETVYADISTAWRTRAR